MATFIISTMYNKEYFGCMISRVNEAITNPEDINLYATQATVVYATKCKISKNVYSDSVLRSIDTYSGFANDSNRFCIEYGVYATLKFLESKLGYGDKIIIAGSLYVRPLVRGVLEIIEKFEAEMVGMCYEHNVLFTNTMFQCGLRAKFDSMKASPYMIANVTDYRWIEG